MHQQESNVGGQTCQLWLVKDVLCARSRIPAYALRKSARVFESSAVSSAEFTWLARIQPVPTLGWQSLLARIVWSGHYAWTQRGYLRLSRGRNMLWLISASTVHHANLAWLGKDVIWSQAILAESLARQHALVALCTCTGLHLPCFWLWVPDPIQSGSDMGPG